MKWNTFAAVYENNDSLSRIQKALSLQRKRDSLVTIRRLSDGMDYRPVLKELHALSICNVIIDVSPSNVIEVLYQAKEVKLLGDYCNFLITYLVLLFIYCYTRRCCVGTLASSRRRDWQSFAGARLVRDYIKTWKIPALATLRILTFLFTFFWALVCSLNFNDLRGNNNYCM